VCRTCLQTNPLLSEALKPEVRKKEKTLSSTMLCPSQTDFPINRSRCCNLALLRLRSRQSLLPPLLLRLLSPKEGNIRARFVEPSDDVGGAVSTEALESVLERNSRDVYHLDRDLFVTFSR
jgi:hypothetical protein